MTTLAGRVVPAPGVVLLPGETLVGYEVEWLPPPKLTPRFDARGNELVPLETFGAVGDVRVLEDDLTFEFAPVPIGKELTLRLRGELGEGLVVCPPLAPGERRFVELELTRGVFRHEGVEGPCRVVSGTAVDERGEPSEGVVVRLRSRETDYALEEVTDEEGRFRFDCAPPEPGLVWVEIDGWSDERRCARGHALDLDVSAQDARGLVLEIERGVTLTGTVLWSDGSPVADFTCDFEGFHAVGESGRFEIEHVSAEPGELWLGANESGRQGWHRARVTPGRDELRLVMQSAPVHALTIHVLDSGGKALDATVWAECDADARLGDLVMRAQYPNRKPDPKVLHVPAGEARIFVQPGKQHCSAERHVRVDSSTELTFVLEPSPKVRGRVLDEEGGPAAEAEVRCGGWGTECEPDGSFELHLPADEPLIAWKEGHGHSEPVPIAAGADSREFVLHLRRACSLELRLERTIPRGEVRLSAGGVTRDLELDASGRLVLTSLPPGPGEVFVLFEGGREGPRVTFELVSWQETSVVLPLR